ncbi:MAG: thioredoxin family protein, partial [Bacteroidota bacterium]
NLFSLLLIGLLVACGGTEAVESEAETTTAETESTAPAPVENTATKATSMLNIGDLVPDFALAGTDGNTYSLADIKAADGSDAKGYVVTFTCNTCPVAKAYEQRLIDLHERTAALGYPVVAIQPNDPEVKPGDGMDAMIERAKDKEYPFAYLLDEGQEIYPQYGATRTPEFFLVSADRKLHYHGAMDDSQNEEEATVSYVDQAIAALEAGEAIDPENVKAVGCTIKTK